MTNQLDKKHLVTSNETRGEYVEHLNAGNFRTETYWRHRSSAATTSSHWRTVTTIVVHLSTTIKVVAVVIIVVIC